MRSYSLFKYKSFDDYTLENLTNDKIWYSNPKYFNDIFDTSIFLEIVRKNLPYNMLEAILRAGLIDKETCKKILISIDKGMGVLSLSNNCKSNTMWAHYGDYHKGYCMEFDFKKVEQDVFSSITTDTQAIKVIYGKTFDIPQITIGGNQDNTYLNKIFLQKSKEWAYENEYRAIRSLKSRDIIYENAKKINDLIIDNNKINTYEISEKVNQILSLFNTNYFFDVDDKIRIILNEIEEDNLEPSIKDLIKQMKIEIDSKGELFEYPSKLVSIIFGNRMSLEKKIQIREALSHLPYEVKFKRIIQNGTDYKLSLEKETFLNT